MDERRQASNLRSAAVYSIFRSGSPISRFSDRTREPAELALHQNGGQDSVVKSAAPPPHWEKVESKEHGARRIA